jgi:hypothetical protein
MSATFVLVHGSWHGGWAWDGVRVHLERAGHRTFAPMLVNPAAVAERFEAALDPVAAGGG